MSFLGLRLGPNIQYDPYTQQMANLSALQWQQATRMFYPVENQLINYAEDPNYIAKMRTQAQGDVNQSFAAQQQGRQQQLGLMGVQPNPAQAAAMSKQTALAKAQSEAGAMNQAAQSAYGNQMAGLQGG